MLLKRTGQLFLAGLSSVLFATSANAASWEVKITNLTHGNHFTPLLVSANTSTTHLFQVGEMASSSLRIMAECGDISSLVTDLGSSADVMENPAGGMLAPGASTTTTLTTSASNTHLSVVAMILPTNDGFVGMDSMEIPTTAGTYTYYLNGYDAGTEANNELLDTSGCAAGMAGIPGAPGMDSGTGGTGVSTADTNTMIHVHRGVLGDTNTSGGSSDLDSTIHRWQNPVAKVTVTVTP